MSLGGGTGGRLGRAAIAAEAPGVRVVIDLRPLQDPGRGPVTAAYLEGLLGAFAADPIPGESFVALLATGPDPTERFPGLPVAGRRRLPPTRPLRAAALTLDPFLLRASELGTTFRAARSGAAGAVFHTAGGPVPLASGLPVVATLLDLAPWELPHAFQATPAARFGQRIRARMLRDAAAVIVGTAAVAGLARRLLHMPRERLHVVPLAADPAFQPSRRLPLGEGFTGSPLPVRSGAGDPAATELPAADPTFESRLAAERERLGLGERYLAFFGRYDARTDLRTLLEALALLARTPRPAVLAEAAAWPPVLLLAGASPDDRAALARAAARHGVGALLAYAPHLEPTRLGLLVAGARAAVLPTVSEAAGLPAVEAVAAGTPVVASAIGALPELVGGGGILVEPRDPARLAAALTTVWSDDEAHARLALAALERSTAAPRTWADVARETRAVYALAAGALTTAGGGRATG
ncbi:MAG TPA: glycosyltransferase [Candidatus Limnocylindrales bacterium]